MKTNLFCNDLNGQSTKEKGKVGKKLHLQFSHPACTKFKGL